MCVYIYIHKLYTHTHTHIYLPWSLAIHYQHLGSNEDFNFVLVTSNLLLSQAGTLENEI